MAVGNLIGNSREFMREFNQAPSVNLYHDLVFEELHELMTAVTTEDQYKEAADLLYVVGGLLRSFHLDPKTLEATYELVHKSNMSKLSDSSDEIFTWLEREGLLIEAIVEQTPSGKYYVKNLATGKVMKGPNYQPPKLKIKPDHDIP